MWTHFLEKAVQIEIMAQVIMTQTRKMDGLVRVMNMLDGTPMMT